VLKSLFDQSSVVTLLLASFAAIVAVWITAARTPSGPPKRRALRQAADEALTALLTGCAVTINAPTAGWALFDRVHQHVRPFLPAYLGLVWMPLGVALAAGAGARLRGFRPLVVWRLSVLAAFAIGVAPRVFGIVGTLLIGWLFSGLQF
jgi:hypothetical protein